MSTNEKTNLYSWYPNVNSLNPNKGLRPIKKKWQIVILVLFIIILLTLFLRHDHLSVNQATVLGVAGSTTISLFVIFVTLQNEKRQNILMAQKNARILSQILDSLHSQISRIQTGGDLSPIVYPQGWINYYEACSLYLQYDYLEPLLKEFELVERINSFILSSEREKITKLLEYRRYIITDCEYDFDIFNVCLNLKLFSQNTKEYPSWKTQKGFKSFQTYFAANYSDSAKKHTVDYLNECQGSCDAKKAAYYVLEKIREDASISSGEYKHHFSQNKEVLSNIFSIYLTLKETDSFSLCWGVLTLKEAKHG